MDKQQKQHQRFMQIAIELSIQNIKQGGGPFGAVIVKNGEIVSAIANSVTKDNDPTAHAEVNAIRQAAKKLNTFDLSGCDIYASCEPCPMCLGAIYWARLDNLYFAANKHDAKDAGFDDSFIYDEIDLPYEKRKVKTLQIMRKDAILAFDAWKEFEDKKEY